MKKQLLLAFYLVVLCLAQSVWAKVWDGKIDSEWYWENPEKTEFTITTAAQLAGLAQLVNGGNNFSDKTIKLGANIMLNDTANWRSWGTTESKQIIKPSNTWTSIGSDSRPFSGTLDGGGNVISGVYINNSSNYQGLFGYVTSGATIKNLGVAASYVKGDDSHSYIGSLIGWNSGTITDCYATGNVNGSNESFVGGLIGWNSGTITKCYAMGNVDGGKTTGGLVGHNEGSTITNCYATGNVKGDGGGLVGNNKDGTITNSYATGNVSGWGGGLVGSNEDGTITNSYATGNLSNGGGGLVGDNRGTITDCYATGNVRGKTAGGLVGRNMVWTGVNKEGVIRNSYATGNVRGETVGGLVGKNEGGTIMNCYAIGYINGEDGYYSAGAGGLVGRNSNWHDNENGVDKGGIIENSYATGNVIAGRKSGGGLVGENYGTTITNCFAVGNVTGGIVGGLIGWNSGTITNSYAMGNVAGSTAGGLVGKNEYNRSSIKKSYSTGNVNGTGSTVGGLVGENDSGSIKKSYYDRQTSGQSDIVKGEPKSTTQMKQQAIFEDWNFDKNWKIDENKNNGYPYLQSSEKNLPVKYKYPQKIRYGNVLTDKRDGKKYKTVVINTQTWMAENLNYNANSSKCYDNKPANCTKYGRLYDWKTAIKACPSGWHLPTYKEWNELNSYADMYVIGADKHLRAKNGWEGTRPYDKHYDQNGTDDFGFSALPGGSWSYKMINYGRGTFGYGYSFDLGGVASFWWSSSNRDSNFAYSHQSIAINDNLFSVRCVKDD